MVRTLQTAGRALQQFGLSDQRVCSSCLRNIQRRHATTAAAPLAESEPTPDVVDQKTPNVLITTAPHQAYNIRAGVLLSRPPILTRDLTSFEKAFYLYQRRLNERLALNFTRYFYFAQDTPQERDWKRKIKDRITPARDIGNYVGKGREAWNDELLMGAKESEPEHQWNALVEDAAIEVEVENQDNVGGEKQYVRQEIEKPQPRVTEADSSNDTRRLDRALQKTLYLLVKTRDGRWELPADSPIGKESLHRAAERILVEGAGPNMNTWMIARHPVGWHKRDYKETNLETDTKIECVGEKTFFIKGRIMAGQANIDKNRLGFADFKWLSREEIEATVDPAYWQSVRRMLVD